MATARTVVNCRWNYKLVRFSMCLVTPLTTGMKNARPSKKLRARARIKPSKNRRTRDAYEKTQHKNRYQVARIFNRFKPCRCVATRREKATENFASTQWSLHSRKNPLIVASPALAPTQVLPKVRSPSAPCKVFPESVSGSARRERQRVFGSTVLV